MERAMARRNALFVPPAAARQWLWREACLCSRVFQFGLLVVVLSGVLACSSRAANSAETAPSPVQSTASAPPEFAPTDETAPTQPVKFAPTAEQLIPLGVEGFLPAVLFVPAGEDARPLVVTTHGAGGTPESLCAYWVRLTNGKAFVLSLRGTPFNSGGGAYFYRDHLALGKELQAALQAARKAFGQRFAAGAGLYSGFSQGATMGVGMIPPYAEQLPHLVMVEGGYDYWSVSHARAFATKGGKRVLFACGTGHCAAKAEQAAEWIRQAGLEARVEHAPGAGHTPGGEVGERVSAALPWVVAGQEAWISLVARE
jgi:predicted esterase